MIITLRESIEYRYSSISFHLGMLRKLQKEALDEIEQNWILGNPDQYDIVFTARRRQQMMFDDVIFNSLTLFDYLGNMIGFSFYGADSGAAKWKWKRAVEFARNSDLEKKQHRSTRYSSSKIAPLILQLNKDWIQRLEGYRAELIHYKADPAGGGHGFSFTQGESPVIHMEITVPLEFTKWIRLPGTQRGECVGLIRAADYIFLKSHVAATQIVDVLRESLGIFAKGL